VKARIEVATGGLALSAALLLGACSGGHSGGSHSDAAGDPATTATIPADAAFNAIDVGFAQGMIPHHQQAIEMADMALAQTTDPDVTRLATAIKAAQQPEIDQLTTWLQQWGQPVPDPRSGESHDMGDMSGMMMSGMMSDAEMERLGDATGTDFDRMWLGMMIVHHEGAVSMADDEIAGGEFAGALAMAEGIRTSQQTEIAEMRSLIDGLPA
jgi:uncharacterized protein (DUF305 family)